MSLRVLVSDKVSRSCLEILEQHGLEVDYLPGRSSEELLAPLATADGWIVRSATQVTAELLAAAPRLRAVGRAGSGVDNVDVAAATARGVVVMNVPGGNTLAVAELAFALVAALARHVPQACASVREGRWEKAAFAGTELAGKTLGVVGFGRIGRALAARARAFEMDVLACDPQPAPGAEDTGVPLVGLQDLLRRSDYVSLHVPLTRETRGLLGAPQLSLMKPTACLVNCARGGVVDEAALAAALSAGALAGAALDVFEQEPPEGNPLVRLPNVICTPHLGASTAEAQEKVGVSIAEQVADALLGRGARHAVNQPGSAPAQRG